MANIKWSAFPDGGNLLVGDQIPILRNGVNTLTTPEKSLEVDNNLSDVADEQESFDNISPAQTKGQMIVSDGTNNQPLPVSTDGKILMLDSAQLLGIKWFTPNYLIKTNNLSDVSNAATSFNNISPAQTKGQMIVSNGSANQALLIGADDTILMADSGQPQGVKWAVGAFLTPANNLSDVDDDTASFDNISPASSKGEIIVSNGTHNVALAASFNTYVLTLDSTQAAGVKWAPPAGAGGAVAGPGTSSINAIATYAGVAGNILLNTTTFVLPTGAFGINTNDPKAGFHYKDSGTVDGNMLFSAKGAVTQADMSNLEVNPYIVDEVLYTAFKDGSGNVFTSAQTQQGLYLNNFVSASTTLTGANMGQMVTATGSSSVVLELPSISGEGLLGQWIEFSFNQVAGQFTTLIGQGGQLIGGRTTVVYPSNSACKLFAGGNGWTITSQNGVSGDYLPTGYLTTNVDYLFPHGGQYSQNGNVVSVSGAFDYKATATGLSTQIGLSLPIASNLADIDQLAGVAFCGDTVGLGAQIYADTTNKRMIIEFISPDQFPVAHTMSYTAQYILV